MKWIIVAIVLLCTTCVGGYFFLSALMNAAEAFVRGEPWTHFAASFAAFLCIASVALFGAVVSLINFVDAKFEKDDFCL